MFFFLLILFFIYPFGSLPLILCLMYQRQKYACYFLGALMATFVMYYAPAGDQYRYWMLLQEMTSVLDTMDNFVDIGAIRRICLIHPFLACVKELGGTLEQARFFLLFLNICLCFNFFSFRSYLQTVLLYLPICSSCTSVRYHIRRFLGNWQIFSIYARH